MGAACWRRSTFVLKRDNLQSRSRDTVLKMGENSTVWPNIYEGRERSKLIYT